MIESRIIQGDCLEVLPDLSRDLGVIFDLVLCDPPFGITTQFWDHLIPFKDLWKCYDQVTKKNTPILLFGAEPFASKLRLSNKNYKYDWVWDKGKGTNPFLAKNRPMPSYENVCVFYKEQPYYNPQYTKGKPYKAPRTGGMHSNNVIGNSGKESYVQKDNDGFRHPLQVLRYSIHCGSKTHPNEKPIKLLEHMIRTYTKENDLVLDNCCGTGSVALACLNTNRRYIGIEQNEEFVAIARERINKHNNYKVSEYGNL